MKQVTSYLLLLLLAIGLILSIYEINSINEYNKSMIGLVSNDNGNVSINISRETSMLVHQRTDLTPLDIYVLSGETNCSFVTGGHNLKISAHNNTIHIFDPDIIYNNSGKGLNSNIITPSNISSWDTGIIGHKNEGCNDITDDDLRKTFHLLENNGNVNIDITASIQSLKLNGVTSSMSTCNFVTGLHDLDGSDGCQNGGMSTRSDVEIGFSLYPIPVSIEMDYNTHMAPQFHFNNYDQIVTNQDYNDTLVSVNQTEGGELRYIRDLNTSEQQLAKKMKWASREDELVILFGTSIPSDAQPGHRMMTIRYTASESI